MFKISNKDNKIEEIFDLVKVGLVVADRNKKIVYINSYIKNLFGNDFNPIGRDILFFHEEKTREKIKKIYLEAKKGNIFQYPIMKLMVKKNSSFLLVRLCPVIDENEVFSGIVGIFYDLTDIVAEKVVNHSKTSYKIIKFPIYTDNKIILIEINDISCVFSHKKGSMIKVKDGKKYFTTVRISYMESEFSSYGFFRTSGSCLLNIKFIKEIIEENDKFYAKTEFGDKIAISKRKLRILKKALKFNKK